MNISQRILYRMNRFYWHHFKDHTLLPCESDPQAAADLIYNILTDDKPCMIARFGATELKCVMNYLSIKNHKREIWNYIRCKTHAWWWTDVVVNDMKSGAGFFSNTPENLEKFSELFLQDLKEIDILGSWLEDEAQILDKIEKSKRVQLFQLEPYFAPRPWSRALEGKKILVVHPFAELIEQQYKERRSKLFSNEDVLPAFELSTLKAIQSIGGENAQSFTDWFEALQWMKDQIDGYDYDICIIGCGAYGMSLAAHVKRMKKKAIHLGGATQMLFGIKGKRWETWPEAAYEQWNLPHNFYQKLINEDWVRPGEINKPRNAQQVENGCYW